MGISPLLLGSGKLETPCERMHREKASAEGELVATAVPDEPPVPLDAELPPHPPVSGTTPAIAMRASALRIPRMLMPAGIRPTP